MISPQADCPKALVQLSIVQGLGVTLFEGITGLKLPHRKVRFATTLNATEELYSGKDSGTLRMPDMDARLFR